MNDKDGGPAFPSEQKTLALPEELLEKYPELEVYAKTFVNKLDGMSFRDATAIMLYAMQANQRSIPEGRDIGEWALQMAQHLTDLREERWMK